MVTGVIDSEDNCPEVANEGVSVALVVELKAYISEQARAPPDPVLPIPES